MTSILLLHSTNTVLLKDIQSAPISATSVINAVKVGDKFFFTSSDLNTRFEMWQSDGTPNGTTLFKAFSPAILADHHLYFHRMISIS